ATADAFLDLGCSPRSLALGQAIVALDGHPAGIFINPAAAGFSRGRTLNFMGVEAFGMADYFTLGGSVQTASALRWTVQSAVLSVTGIPRHPDLRAISGLEARRDSIRRWVQQGFSTFGDRESALIVNGSASTTPTIDLGWQMAPFEIKIPFGMNIRVLNKRLGSLQGTGIGVDLGAMIMLPLSNVFLWEKLGRLTLGASWNNLLGTRLYWNTRKVDFIPTRFVRGLVYEQNLWSSGMVARILVQSSSQFAGRYQWGAEAEIARRLFLRIGRNQDDLQGGVGFACPFRGHLLNINYSFSAHALGPVHRLGITFRFNDQE
ncbi:MAG: hypothetical protein ACE5D1_06445, partial [Fidelibacterota bacterium]